MNKCWQVNSLDSGGVLVALLSVCGEIQTRVQLWITELVCEPLHVSLQRRRNHVLQNLPVRRNHGVTSVSESSETHDDGQLFVSIIAVLHELARVSLHLWSELEPIGQLKTKTRNKQSIYKTDKNLTVD